MFSMNRSLKIAGLAVFVLVLLLSAFVPVAAGAPAIRGPEQVTTPVPTDVAPGAPAETAVVPNTGNDGTGGASLTWLLWVLLIVVVLALIVGLMARPRPM